MLQYQSVPHELRDLLDQLMQLDELSDFVLVGGTSLGLRYGHRISVDIDLFAHSSFNVDDLDRILESAFICFF